MSRNLSEKKLIRSYFLGDLPEGEEDHILERSFTDPDFYEKLLIIQGELVDDYALGLISEEERKKLEKGFLVSPHQYQKVRIVRTLKQYISNIKPSAISANNEERNSVLACLGPQIRKSKEAVLGRKSRQDSQHSAHVWERILKEAHANRELILSLTDDDWLGLRLLFVLKSNPLTTPSHIAFNLNGDHPELDVTLSRLMQCGLVERLDGRYSCSWFGSEILEKVKTISNSHLDL